ncbi:BON domain-containing protein [Microvirga alba]|uniref:BON domain-containing protein n=1 Tax=Microvirga alba TaxID=2791025 RepID=A0A931BQC9_9HYPH|nr:BON domain-containing protein [Microvirga alba]MBF9232653.1 BON domain-containing protein [Microvirga alba]
MDDKILRQLVLDELDYEPSIDAAHIGVAVEKGVVTLSGHVGSYAEKVAVEHAVQRTKGVRAVAEEIEVRYPTDKKTSDDEIAKRALNILAWDARVPDDAVQVKVQKGWITLTGHVEWQYQRLAAESAIRKLSGVVGVANMIEIKPRVQAPDVEKKILEALKRSAEIEADSVKVTVKDDKVVLDGKVHDWYERVVIERAAWSAPGVKAVEDRLVVA